MLRRLFLILGAALAGVTFVAPAQASPCRPLLAPTGLVVTGTTATSVSLDWNSSPCGSRDYYTIYTYTANGTTLLKSARASTSAGTVSGLSAATTYVFRTTAIYHGTESPKSSPVTATTAGAPPPPPPSDMPVGDLPGWHQIKTEDFTTPSAPGSWGTACDPSHVDYTGATGTKWRSYPRCYNDTDGRPYRSDLVLSTHDGVLDFNLNGGGVVGGANPSPILNDTTLSQYQVYGRYSMRFRVDRADMSDYKTAILLWPHNDADWQCAESDYPEAQLTDSVVAAFDHYGCGGSQDYFPSPSFDRTAWHTFTQEWGPGFRRYYFDGTIIGSDTTHPVYASEERWQFQVETGDSVTGTANGHLLVDWAVVYSCAGCA